MFVCYCNVNTEQCFKLSSYATRDHKIEFASLGYKHNRHNGRDKSGCNAGWAYLGMLAKIKLLSGQEGRLASSGREIAQQQRVDTIAPVTQLRQFHCFNPNKLRLIGSLISNYKFLYRQILDLRLTPNSDLILTRYARYQLSYVYLSCSSEWFSYLKLQMK